MAIDEPILAFTLSRTEAAPPTLPRDEEWDHRAPSVSEPEREREREREAMTPAAEFDDDPPELNFDYVGVPAENVAEIGMLVSRIKASRKRHVEAVHDVGADLLRAKKLLGHGNFLPWLQAEFRWSERTANNYMSIARFFKGKTANLADLDIGTASALAAKSTPSEIRSELLERIEAGENISREEVKERLAAGRNARKRTQSDAVQDDTSEAAPIDRTRDVADLPNALVEFEKTFETETPSRALSEEPQDRRAADDLRARDAVNAILDIESPIACLCALPPREAAQMLLSAANEHEQMRVQKVISLVLQIKQAIDEHVGVLNALELQPTS
jgi:Protein of unknown function (DUF3102)